MSFVEKLKQLLLEASYKPLSHLIGKGHIPRNIPWKEDINKPIPKFFDRTIKVNHESFKPKADHRQPYKILCLDGGGVRGMLTISLLTRIARHNPEFMKSIDLIAGTSAGGILALMLASGYTPQECEDLYSFAAPHIFTHNPYRCINPTRARYSDKSKQEIMQYYFGERTMADLQKNCIAIAFRMDGKKSQTHSFFNKEGWRPAVFSNMPQFGGSVLPDNDLFVWDAAMRTSAAPTFFPVFKGYTDGGVIANNPSMIAVSKAMAHFPTLTPRNITVLSIGAGAYPRHLNIWQQQDDSTEIKRANKVGDTHQLMRADWGIKQWLPFLVDLLLDGDSVTTEMVMHYLLGESKLYHRLEPKLPREIVLDDVTALTALRDFAQTIDITETDKFIRDNFLDVTRLSDELGSNQLDSASSYHTAWERHTIDSHNHQYKPHEPHHKTHHKKH